MENFIKYIIKIAIGIIVIVMIFFLFEIIFLGYSTDFTTWKNYTWLVKDESRICSSCKFVSYSGNENIYSVFKYSDNKRLTVWENKELSNIELDSIDINKKVDLFLVKFFTGQQFNVKSDRTVDISYFSKLDMSFVINLDNQAKIYKEIKSENYKGFYGEIYRMSFSNGPSNHQVLMRYVDGLTPVLFLLYKAKNSFFILIVDSTEPFDESIIDDLDL